MKKTGIYGLGKNQRYLINWMRKGFYIQETHDLYRNETDRWLTNGDDDILSIQKATLQPLVDRGLLNIHNWSPSIQIDITEFRLKPEYQ